MSDFNTPGSPSEEPPAAYSPPAPAPGSPAPGVYTAPTGQVPERLGGPYYSPGLVILLSIVTLGIWTFLWVYRTNEDLKRYNGDGLGGVLAVVLHLLLGVVLMFTIPNEIKNMYERDGRESPMSAIWGLWFLLPIIGWLVWYFRAQRSLNDFWLSKGSMPG